MQPYLYSNIFSTSEKQLLFFWRSKCYSEKNNFKKLRRKNLKCVMRGRLIVTLFKTVFEFEQGWDFKIFQV